MLKNRLSVGNMVIDDCKVTERKLGDFAEKIGSKIILPHFPLVAIMATMLHRKTMSYSSIPP